MKIIFLDFDGVITTYDSQWNLSSSCVLSIEHILKVTGAKIVITSSWAIGSLDASHFINKLFNKPEVTITSKNSLFITSIIDIINKDYPLRGEGIQEWLDNHPDVTSYVILDDNSDMLDEQLFNFVQTDTYYGITAREVDLAIRILNEEKITFPVRLNHTLLFKWYDNLNSRQSNIDVLLNSYFRKFK